MSEVAAPAVEVVGVQKRFGDHEVLRGIDLVVAPREFVSLLGPSGCGKTTLLRIIAGFEDPTRGSVRLHGAEMTKVPPHRRPTNIVFQRGALFPHMNVAENIGYSLKLRGWPKTRIASRVEELLALVRLEGLGSRGPTQLSGGQIQRAALARALAPEPEVLLLDEPLSALDLKLRQHMQLELRALHRQLGATFIYVTHDQVEAMVMSDRIAVMNEGLIVQLGTPREIYQHPTSVFASDFIGDTNLVHGIVTRTDGASVTLATSSGAVVTGQASEALVPGMAVTLSVRPGAVRVRRADGSAAAMSSPDLEAEVSEIIYLGDRIRIEADAGAGLIISADVREEEGDGIERTMRVRLGWAPTAANVWADSPGDEGSDVS
jgi:ABC-type Fe3+/spermidine/putrescine transport system ATPase subunit